MQRLRSAQHGRQRLQRHARDVVHRLLRGQGHARRLRVKAHQPRARVLRAEPVFHQPVPDLPRSAILGDLFEEIVVRIEEETQPRAEVVHVKPAPPRPLDVLDAVVNA